MAIRPFHKVYLPGAPYGHSAVSQGSPFKFYQESTGITIISTRFSAIIVTVQPSGFTVTLSESFHHACGHQAGFPIVKIDDSVFSVYFFYVRFIYQK